ncbi:MAG: hypothetical protein JJ892_12300 [Balneola sp.]|nr:hypothetical protein [Balneola sp.]MBO6652052.1 hypothetical protein [Balneola sp.]MBO6712457.1 hypothetical protein [Balneola sp.]MBO6801050.1 hypothetical protein [Balneola sp.]MBO6870722.1 hypothetical protein [Balneola sp.]
MKKLSWFLIPFVMLPLLNQVKGQEIIQFDLNDPASHIGLDKKLRNGDWYQVRLKNINLNAYMVNVSIADSFYTFTLKTPSFKDLPMDLISTLSSDLLSSIDISLFESVDKGNIETLSQKYYSRELSHSPNNPLAELIQIASLMEQDIFDFKNLYNSKMQEVNIQRNEAIVEGAINQSLNALFQKNLKELHSEIDLLNQKIKIYLLAVNDFLVQNAAAISKDPLKADVEKLKAFNTELVKSQNKLNEALSAEKISSMLLQSRFIDKNKTMTYTTMPQRFNGTKATVSVVLTPRDSSYMLNAYSTKFVIDQKKSFYFGTGLSFYIAGFSDQNFSTVKETSATDTTYSVVAEDPTKFEVGISSLLRAGLYHQYENRVELGGHLSFGPGVSISEKVRPRILFGLGISIGSGKHAVSIDGGFIFGSEQQKSNSINDGDIFSERPENLTVNTPTTSWFGSFGYMLKF